VPVVVAGFEPLDILAALVRLVELIRDGEARVENYFPRCVSKEGNQVALAQLHQVFELREGRWRGIADIPDGNLRLRPEYAAVDARRRFEIDSSELGAAAPRPEAAGCICGDIMAGLQSPFDCKLFGKECRPEAPVGACMVSNEGTCKIWHLYGGRPDLRMAETSRQPALGEVQA
jgi:hydrogenase expression/formation protein HypD